MGISIDQYRLVIGSFIPTRKNSYKMVMNHESVISISRKYFYTCVLLYLLVSVFAANQSIHVCTVSTQQNVLLKSTACLSSLLPDCFSNVLAYSTFKMVTNFQSRYTYGNKKSTGIKISHWNKGRGFLANKLTEIKSIVTDINPHILGISEANFYENHDQNQVRIEHYNLHISDTINNPALKVARTVVYTHQSLMVKPRPDLMSNDCSSVWLEVGLPRQKKIIVGHVYREWQLLGQLDDSSLSVPEQLNRWCVFLSQWEKALESGLEVHVLGDLNLNHCEWNNYDLPSNHQTSRMRPLIMELFTRILPLGVVQLVRGPTRFWPGHTPTGLDHYFTNNTEKISAVSKKHHGGSDHVLIYATRYSKQVKSAPRYVRKRSYKKFDPLFFVQTVKQIKWFDIYMCQDVNTAVQLLSSKLTFILDTMAPMKTVQIRKHYVPWLSRDTQALMKERDRLHKVASVNGNNEDWQNFKNIRNKINNKLKFEEKKWHAEKIKLCGSNSSKMWKCVKGVLNWNRSSQPTQLYTDGCLISKPADIAETLNDYFITKIKNIRSNLPTSTTDPLKVLKSLMVGRNCHFSFSTVHPDEVLDVINGLSNSTSFGLDEIDTQVIKLVKLDILPVLTHIINLSLTTHQFPKDWKNSKIIPLLKKGDSFDPKNYRPVAIIPILSKVLERIVFNQISIYLSENHHEYRNSTQFLGII